MSWHQLRNIAIGGGVGGDQESITTTAAAASTETKGFTGLPFTLIYTSYTCTYSIYLLEKCTVNPEEDSITDNIVKIEVTPSVESMFDSKVQIVVSGLQAGYLLFLCYIFPKNGLGRNLTMYVCIPTRLYKLTNLRFISLLCIFS